MNIKLQGLLLDSLLGFDLASSKPQEGRTSASLTKKETLSVFNPFDALGFVEWMLPVTIESGLVYKATNIVTEICFMYILKSYKAHREVVIIGEKRFSSVI